MAGDEAISADVLVAGELVLVSRREVVRMAVLEVRERETAPRGALAVSVAIFLGFLTAASLKPRPTVVLAAPVHVRYNGRNLCKSVVHVRCSDALMDQSNGALMGC